MRLIMLDTETTGLSPFSGDRIVEIGAVEVVHRSLEQTRNFHHYVNPGRPIPDEVVRIHGISDAHVQDKPGFADIAGEFLEFIDGATLVIHNAPFDLGFIMNELSLAGLSGIDTVPVIDTLDLARKRHPHQRNNLDALCDRYRIERGHRTLHGALLDSQLLAEVYLAMTGGRQFSLTSDIQPHPASTFVRMPEQSSRRDEKAETATLMRREPPPIHPQEMQAHMSLMARIHKESNGKAIWQQPSPSPQD
jgi:DNA polymerase-3 subunit epsilon